MTGEEFKEIRNNLELSTAQLSEILNVGKRTIMRWEQDNPPPHPCAGRIMEWMADDIFWPPEAPF